jgi:hypothetical protein
MGCSSLSCPARQPSSKSCALWWSFACPSQIWKHS